MTTTSDPTHPLYLDEADTRQEMARVFDVCNGCRRCVDFCGTFPSLFDLIEGHGGDAGRMTPAEQDHVVAQCHGCTRCVVECPYAPGLDAREIDVPRLVLRAVAMQWKQGVTGPMERSAARLRGRTDLVGSVAARATGAVNRVVGARPRSIVRRLLTVLTGLSAVRRLPTFAGERFSRWFDHRLAVRLVDRQGSVTVFPSCLVEYQAPTVGTDLVKVYERNGIECAATAAGCCGAPSLYAGDIGRFGKVARRNVAALAAEIRRGTEIVVPQPSCAHVIRHAYPDHVRTADAEFVAAHTHDAVEFLMRLHRSDDAVLDTDFGGETVASVVYHPSCPQRADDIGVPARDLLRLTGARVTVVARCAGTDTDWAWLARHDTAATELAGMLGRSIEDAGGVTIAGDCHRARAVITEQTGRVAVHPLQVIARAYGFVDEL